MSERINSLIEMALHGNERPDRTFAISKLSESLDCEGVFQTLQQLSEDDNHLIRITVASALRENGRASEIGILLPLLDDEEGTARFTASDGMMRIVLRCLKNDDELRTLKNDEELIRGLLRALVSKDSVVRENATKMRAILKGSGSLKSLLEALDDPDPKVGQGAFLVVDNMLSALGTPEELDAFEKAVGEVLNENRRKDGKNRWEIRLLEMVKSCAAKKDAISRSRDITLDGIPKPPKKPRGRMWNVAQKRLNHRPISG